MKQLIIQNGQVIVADVPAPIAQPGQILVKVAYSLISIGTEMSAVTSSGKSLVQRAVEQPEKVKQVFQNIRQVGLRKTLDRVTNKLSEATPIGYSCAGVVIAVGEGISDINIGDQVACAGAGLANHAEVVLIPRNLLVKIPTGCTQKQAASVTLGAIALQGVRRAEPRLGDMVAVVGLGLLGQITVQLLKANGCQVIGLDLDQRRVDTARQLGADHAFLPSQENFLSKIKRLTSNQGVDATIITAASSSDAIVQQAMEMTRKKGRVVVVGAVGMNLKRSPFYEKEIDFIISCSYGPGRYDEQYETKGLDYPYAYVRWTENRNMAEYLRLIASGDIHPEAILEREFPLEEAPQAYGLLQSSSVKPLGVLLSYMPATGEKTTSAMLSTKVSRHPAAPNGKIGVAVIGAGNFARAMHLPNLKGLSSQYQLIAIADVNGVNAKNTAAQFGVAYATTSYDDILADENVHLVMICTRHHLHAAQTLAALQAGKHVFVEKPLALTPEELTQIEAFFEDGGSATRPVLMTGYNRRFSPFAQQIRTATAQRHDPMILNYRMNAGYIPLDNWVHTNEGGGRNLGEACHIYDLFTYLTQSKVDRVEAQSIQPKTNYYSSCDNFIATLRFMDGSLATLTYTALGTAEYPKELMEVYVDGKVLMLDDYKKLSAFGVRLGHKNKGSDKGHLNELQVLAKSIQGQVEWPIPLWQQVQAPRIAFEIEKSL